MRAVDTPIDSLLARAVDMAVGAGYPIHRASVRVLTDDGAALRIVAVWGETSEVIRPGVVLGVGATSFPEVIRNRGSVSSTMIGETLAGEVLRQEGINAWVAIPLRNHLELPIGLLNLSSTNPTAFPSESIPILEQLVKRIAAELVSRVSAESHP